jgi:exopolysaccharide biosynthesis polyprenyl glycosylphosphotransferase
VITPTQLRSRGRAQARPRPPRRPVAVEQLLPRQHSAADDVPTGWRPDEDALRPQAARRREQISRRLLAGADAAATTVTLVVCVQTLGGVQDRRLPAFAIVVAALICVALAKALGLYERDELTLKPSTLDEAPRLFQLATLWGLVVWVVGEPVLGWFLGRDQMLAVWAGQTVALVAARMAAREIARRITPVDRCLLVGERGACARAERKIRESHGAHAQVVAAITSDELGDRAVATEALETIAARSDIHRLVVAPGPEDQAELLDLVRAAKALGLKVSVLPRMLEVVGSSVVFDDVEGVALLGVRRFGLSRSAWVLKRATDAIGAAIGLVVLAPTFAVIALAIKLDSRGPVLYRQQRVGRDGRTFSMAKFRTMVDGADRQKDALRNHNQAQGLFKIADDPRITRVGRLLRRTSLDELPQLLNVLRGEMSLVGPRPLVPEDDQRVVGWYRRRLHLTPGMTGRWQVLGSARIPLQEMVKLDYLYAANWSLWLDVKIMLRTIAFVLSRRGL